MAWKVTNTTVLRHITCCMRCKIHCGSDMPKKNQFLPLFCCFYFLKYYRVAAEFYLCTCTHIYALHEWMTSYQRSLPTWVCVWTRENVDARSKTTHGIRTRLYVRRLRARMHAWIRCHNFTMLYCWVGNSTMANFKVSLRISTGISWCRVLLYLLVLPLWVSVWLFVNLE